MSGVFISEAARLSFLLQPTHCATKAQKEGQESKEANDTRGGFVSSSGQRKVEEGLDGAGGGQRGGLRCKESGGQGEGGEEDGTKRPQVTQENIQKSLLHWATHRSLCA